MKFRILIILLFVFSGCFKIESEVSVNENIINYPKTKKVDQVDDYHGHLVELTATSSLTTDNDGPVVMKVYTDYTDGRITRMKYSIYLILS